MAFAIAYPTYTAGSYEKGRRVTLYVPDGCRQIIGILDGVKVLNGKGEEIYSRKSEGKPIRLSAEITVYPLAEDEDAPTIDHFSELD